MIGPIISPSSLKEPAVPIVAPSRRGSASWLEDRRERQRPLHPPGVELGQEVRPVLSISLSRSPVIRRPELTKNSDPDVAAGRGRGCRRGRAASRRSGRKCTPETPLPGSTDPKSMCIEERRPKGSRPTSAGSGEIAKAPTAAVERGRPPPRPPTSQTYGKQNVRHRDPADQRITLTGPLRAAQRRTHLSS